MEVQDPDLNAKIQSFRYAIPNATPLSDISDKVGMAGICNFEMESSALAGLSSILGHRAMTCCMVIANRYAREMNTGYKNKIDDLIRLVLERI